MKQAFVDFFNAHLHKYFSSRRFFIVTVQSAYIGGYTLTSRAISCRYGIFGDKEIKDTLKESIQEANPELTYTSNPLITSFVEINKAQYLYYINN